MLDEDAREVRESELDEVLASGYGIFSGREVDWARLRFSPERARWVATEQWHPQQRSHFEADGSYVLELPYSDPRELVMDVLRHGSEAEVLAPDSLRQTMREALEGALKRYPA